MQLLVDVGNSRIKWCYWNGQTLSAVGSEAHCHVNFDRLLHQIWGEKTAPSKIWISNVAGAEIHAALVCWISTVWRIRPRFLQTESNAFGVSNGYHESKSLGIDRWLNLIATYNNSKTKSPFCVIDCGTCITVDALDADGMHLGGLILPGIQTMRQAVIQSTAECTLEDASPMMGSTMLARSTKQGLWGGTLFAAVSYLERLVDEMTLELGHDLKIIVTGGEADLLLSLMGPRFELREHLVFEGIIHYVNEVAHA